MKFLISFCIKTAEKGSRDLSICEDKFYRNTTSHKTILFQSRVGSNSSRGSIQLKISQNYFFSVSNPTPATLTGVRRHNLRIHHQYNAISYLLSVNHLS